MSKQKHHFASLLSAYGKHYESILEIGQEALTTGKYPVKKLLADSLALSLDCYATLTDCLYSCAATDSDEFDQLSEAAGPLLIPGFGPQTAATSRLPSVRMDGSGATISRRRVSLRKLENGHLHFALTDLTIMPALPPDEYTGVISGISFTATKVIRERAPLQFGAGAVPSYLRADSSLDLDRLLFE